MGRLQEVTERCEKGSNHKKPVILYAKAVTRVFEGAGKRKARRAAVVASRNDEKPLLCFKRSSLTHRRLPKVLSSTLAQI